MAERREGSPKVAAPLNLDLFQLQKVRETSLESLNFCMVKSPSNGRETRETKQGSSRQAKVDPETRRNPASQACPPEVYICGATVPIAFPELLDVLGVLLQRLDEPREGGRHVREVRDAAADDQELAIRVLVPLF